MAEGSGVYITGVDVLDVIKLTGSLGKKHQAITLAGIEEIIDKDTEEYQQIRKIVLDNFNNYTRAVLGVVFGEIDFSWH